MATTGEGRKTDLVPTPCSGNLEEPHRDRMRELIRRMSQENIGWGAPRIFGELQMLGIDVSQATVAKYMVRQRKPPSQT